MTSTKSPTRKQSGSHYTPERLAQFLASQMVLVANEVPCELTVLDPACGDGSLLAAMSDQVTETNKLKLVGYETNASAVEKTRLRLSSSRRDAKDRGIVVHHADFLQHVASHDCQTEVDWVIANPPYVRTQVLGQRKSQELAKAFNLTGRIDLYHAFTVAISQVIRPGGILGLLTSNRFMTIQSGKMMRQALQRNFDILNIFDLGDTRLFEAAVLPVVVIARRKFHEDTDGNQARFSRLYRSTALPRARPKKLNHVLDVFDSPNWFQRESRHYRVGDVCYQVKVGRMEPDLDAGQPWIQRTKSGDRWLECVRKHQFCTFRDISEIKVGIKTTADKVFIQKKWPETLETELLFPLITHHITKRWQIAGCDRKVLYPYQIKSTRQTIALSKFPEARRYLENHRQQLEKRNYVLNAGRKWFEIWVPHQPADWKNPKIVWPDISEQPRFCFDDSGAIVNGDCYWLKLRPGIEQDWLYLILAIANSSVSLEFYDLIFHNKLYSGRRRFMTQYVADFPLPDLSSELSQKIVLGVKHYLRESRTETHDFEAQNDQWVREAFGLG